MPKRSSIVPSRAAGRPANSSPPSAAQRNAQSARDKSAHQAALRAMRATANLQSIPRGPPQKKESLFTRGALKTPQFAPRGHGYYDAFVQKPDSVVVSATTGPATVISGYSSDTIAGSGSVTGTYTLAGGLSGTYTGNATLVVFNPGSSDNVLGKAYKVVTASGGTVAMQVTPITASQFDELGPTRDHSTLDAAHHDADTAVDNLNPTRRVESIPLRGSLRIRNITEALSVGGTVRALRYNGGLQMNTDATPFGTPDVQGFLTVCSMVRDSHRTKIFNGEELRAAHQSNTYPADFVRSMAFENDTTFAETMARPSYCSLLILIDDFTASNTLTNNSYEVSVMVQRAARFGMGTLLGGMARALPVRPTHEHAAAAEATDPLIITV